MARSRASEHSPASGLGRTFEPCSQGWLLASLEQGLSGTPRVVGELGTALSNASPALVQVHWPQRDTTAAARHYLAVAEAMVQIIAEFATALAHYKAGGER